MHCLLAPKNHDAVMTAASFAYLPFQMSFANLAASISTGHAAVVLCMGQAMGVDLAKAILLQRDAISTNLEEHC